MSEEKRKEVSEVVEFMKDGCLTGQDALEIFSDPDNWEEETDGKGQPVGWMFTGVMEFTMYNHPHKIAECALTGTPVEVIEASDIPVASCIQSHRCREAGFFDAILGGSAGGTDTMEGDLVGKHQL